MSLSNNKIKQVRALQRKKIRRQEGLFLAEGTKIAQELLKQQQVLVREIFALDQWLLRNEHLLSATSASIHPVDAVTLKQISTLDTPNQVVLLAQQPQYTFDAVATQQQFSLYLDDLQDPGNMGTILRIADWFGIPYVFLGKGCVEIYNAKVVQSSMGAFLRVQTIEMPLQDLRTHCPELHIYGAMMEGEDILRADLPDAAVLVIGNEGRGISASVQSLLTHQITIPKGKNGGAESLNAAVATGILCSQFMRP